MQLLLLLMQLLLLLLLMELLLLLLLLLLLQLLCSGECALLLQREGGLQDELRGLVTVEQPGSLWARTDTGNTHDTFIYLFGVCFVSC